MARLFVRNLEPPYRLRFKVLRQLAPQEQSFKAAWRDFVESQSDLPEVVYCATGRAIDEMKIKAPVYARIRYNIYGALCILVAHQRRHLWQVEQIVKALDRRQARTSVA
jgi:hypothetical protein